MSRPFPSRGSSWHHVAPAGTRCLPCDFYAQARCDHGANCNFCHYPHDKQRSMVPSLAPLAAKEKDAPPPASQFQHTLAEPEAEAEILNPVHQTIRGRAYKTEMCRHFERLGRCHFGASCNFAHSDEEIKAVLAAAAAEACPWFRRGACRFGTRCRNRHSENDSSALPECNMLALEEMD